MLNKFYFVLLEVFFSMDAYKFSVLVAFLFFLVLGSVSAADDNSSFEPLNDSFLNNEFEVIDEYSSNFNNISDDDFNYSAEDLKNDSEYLNSSLDDRGGGDSPLSLIQTTITAFDLEMYYRDGSVVYATLKDSNDNPLVNKTVIYIFAGQNYIRITNGIGRVAMGIYARPGNYTVNITFQETGYASSSKTVYVTVNEMPTGLFASDLVMFYRDGSALAVDLRDVYNSPLVNKTIVFNLVGHDYTRVSNSNGRVGFGIFARPGNYTIYITFEGIGYVSSSKTVFVVVNEMPTTIVASNLIMEYGDNFGLYAYLKDINDNPLVNKTMDFNINGQNCSRISNGDGSANVEINLWPGLYNATISFTQIGYIPSVETVQITVTINGILPPTINLFSGFYDSDYLLVNFSGYAQDYIIYYSFDGGIHWAYDNNYVCFNLTSGNWSIKYFSSYQNQNSSILTVNYLIDGSAPICWASHGSGIYSEDITVNLTSVDFFDENPMIYYTTDGENPTLNSEIYQNPIFIQDNTNLRFFARDSFNHISEVISIYYFIGENVCNLNNGKTYSRISDAISDPLTIQDDVIEVSDGVFEENLTINKTITLIGNNNSQIKGNIFVLENNVSIYSCNLNSILVIVGDNFNLINSNLTALNGSILNIAGSNSVITWCNLRNTGGSVFHITNTAGILFSDCMINSTSGNYLFNSTNCVFLNNSFLKNNYTIRGENKFYLIDSFNNTFYGNNISCGLVLNNSGDNLFYSNWISDNLNFYLVYIDSPYLSNTFYLNYIYNGVWKNNKLQGVFVSRYSHVDLSNNWWGSRVPRINIMYTRQLDIVLEGFITINTYIGSYHVENGIIYSVEVIADLTCNIRGEDLSNIGFVPDGISVNFYSDFESFNSTIVNGKSKYMMSVNLDENCTTFFTRFALDSNSVRVNKIAEVNLHVVSTALCNGSGLDFSYNFPLNGSVSWFSLIYRSLDNFTSQINLVVDGEIVKRFEVMSSYYVYCKKSGVCDNVLNAVHMYNDCLYNEYSKIRSDIDVCNALDFDIFDLDQLHSQFSEGIYVPMVFSHVLDYFNVSKEDVLLELIGNYFNLSMGELNFVRDCHDLFQDMLMLNFDYPGDVAKRYNVDDFELEFMGNNIYAYTDITYINGAYTHLDETVSNYNVTCFQYAQNNITYADGFNRGHLVNSDYDGFLTFTFVCDKLSDEDLVYWLNEKNKTYTNGSLVYDGFMKACYGSFLNGFLTYYCIDKVADISADKFNVSWDRSSPICVSVYDNCNVTVLSGRSDFRFGMDVYGDDVDVRAFRFVVTSMFSQIEYWVMKSLFPDNSPYGSVTMGLANLLLDGPGLEFFLEDNLLVIRENGTNRRVLVFELDTGIFSDLMFNVGQGSYCYYDQQTEWAYSLGLFLGVFDDCFNMFFEEFMESFVDFLNGSSNFIDSIEDGINRGLNDTFGFLDGVDDFSLGLIGSTAVTVGVGLLLVSNPIGWGIGIGAGLLIGAGIVTTYFADDLNRGWNYNRAAHFTFDVVTSMIPAAGPASFLDKTAGRLGKIMLYDGSTTFITKKSVNEGFGKFLLDYAEYQGGVVRQGSKAIVKFGTIESIINTMYYGTGSESVWFLLSFFEDIYFDIIINHIFPN